MVSLNLSRAIKDGPDGCLIGVDGARGYQSSVVRPEKNASVSNREIKSSLAMQTITLNRQRSETGKINSTQNPCRGGCPTSLVFGRREM